MLTLDDYFINITNDYTIGSGRPGEGKDPCECSYTWHSKDGMAEKGICSISHMQMLKEAQKRLLAESCDGYPEVGIYANSRMSSLTSVFVPENFHRMKELKKLARVMGFSIKLRYDYIQRDYRATVDLDRKTNKNKSGAGKLG
jgi:hypothetical protein